MRNLNHNPKNNATRILKRFLRPPRGWEEDERPGGARHRLARFLDDAADGEPLLDLLVVDEAHYMRNPETLTHRAGELLNSVSTWRVFLSATPIHLRNRDLHSLLKLIDPDTFEYPDTLDELIQTNAPIVAARDLLGRTEAGKHEIIEEIETAQGFQLLAGNRTLARVCNELTARSLDPAARAELAILLDGANQLSNFIVRTRRRDVEEFRIQRVPRAPFLDMNELERKFYDDVTEEIRAYASLCDINERFILSTPQRLLTSSMAAAAAHWAAADRRSEDEIEETDDDLDRDLREDARPLVGRLAALVRGLNINDDLAKRDTKFDFFLGYLRDLWESGPREKIVVFSSFKPTLFYLHGRLAADAVESELLHGSVSEPRHIVLKRFRENPDTRVLLSSEVGGEGVDLQFCGIVVNYDLPWNPMRIEQRVGRIDRLGQSREKIDVVNLFYSNTIDELIYRRLYERLEITTQALGDFEALLGDPIREMTRQLLDPSMDDRGRRDVVDRAATVLERQKKEKEKLEHDAGALIAYGDYILQKIRGDHDRRRWIDAGELLLFLKDSMQTGFPGCAIVADPPGSTTHKISLSHEALEEFRRFAVRARHGRESRLLEGDARTRYRFTSSVADKTQGGVEPVSQLHPLVRFAVELDENAPEAHKALSVAAVVERARVAADVAPGLYVIAVQRWSMGGTDVRAGGRDRLACVGAGANGAVLPPDLAETMAAAAADYGDHLQNFANDERLGDAVTILNGVVFPEIDRRFEDFLARTRADVEERFEIRERALVRHFESKKKNLEERQIEHGRQAAVAEELGQARRAQQLRALAGAAESRARKLEANVRLRLAQLERQREVHPESEDVACILLDVRP